MRILLLNTKKKKLNVKIEIYPRTRKNKNLKTLVYNRNSSKKQPNRQQRFGAKAQFLLN